MNTTILWGVDIWRLAAAIGLLFASFLSRPLITSVFRIIGRRSKSTQIKWDDEASALLPKPLALVMQVLLWRLAVSVIQLPVEPVDIGAIVGKGLEAALIFGLVWTLFRMVDVVARVGARAAEKTETRIDDQAIPLLRKTLKVLVAFVGAIFAVQNLGYSVTSVLAGLGIGGLALALAAQDSVANFFGSVVLFTDAPFQVGDFVEFEGISGTVEEVGFRTTRIRLVDSSLACVPNKTFTASFITNYAARTGRRIDLNFGLASELSADDAREFLFRARKAFKQHQEIQENSAEIHLADIQKAQITIRAAAFTKSTGWSSFLQTREELILELLSVLDELNLKMAKGTLSMN